MLLGIHTPRRACFSASASTVTVPLLLLGSHVLQSYASAFVYGVRPALVQVHEKDHVVPEARNAVHGGHANDEREEVVDEGVHEPEAQEPPRQVGDGLEVVVDEQLKHRGKMQVTRP